MIASMQHVNTGPIKPSTAILLTVPGQCLCGTQLPAMAGPAEHATRHIATMTLHWRQVGHGFTGATSGRIKSIDKTAVAHERHTSAAAAAPAMLSVNALSRETVAALSRSHVRVADWPQLRVAPTAAAVLKGRPARRLVLLASAACWLANTTARITAAGTPRMMLMR